MRHRRLASALPGVLPNGSLDGLPNFEEGLNFLSGHAEAMRTNIGRVKSCGDDGPANSNAKLFAFRPLGIYTGWCRAGKAKGDFGAECGSFVCRLL
jgi:hypothetical protein